MEKVCEFCAAFRPVVYCKADAAHLCLSCDAKVHSANALSNRHLRTLLCYACKYRQCSVRCLDHHMFMCRSCDNNLHCVSSRHQRRMVNCYTGCPSAKDFAMMWGFQLNEMNGNAVSDQSLSVLRGSLIKSNRNCSTLVASAECDAGSSSQQNKMYMKGQFQGDNGFIFQQILELERLQLTEGNDGSLLMCGHEQTDISSSVCDLPKELDENLNQGPEQSLNRIIDLPQTESPINELMRELSPSPFAQVEHLSSSSTIGDSFWQCKSPTRRNQLWHQNLQDIGVCEDLVQNDDFNIPDIDLTFRNFEELFGADQEPIGGLVDDNNVSCSSVESLGKSDKRNARATEQDASVAFSTYSDHFAETKRDASPSDDSIANTYSLCAVGPSFSSLSFSLTRISDGSSETDCHNTELPPTRIEEVSCSSPRSENLHLGGRENAITRLKEKKKARIQEKQVQYASRRARNDPRRRIKSGLAKTEGCCSDTVSVTRSY